MMGTLARNWWAVVLRGVCAVLFGLGAFVWPGITLAALVLLYGVYALADGVLGVMAAVAGRQPGAFPWGMLLAGVAAIGVGGLTLLWPGLTALVLLYLIAAWAIARGAFEIVAAIALRKEIEHEWLLAGSGVLSVLLGIFLVVSPGAGALALLWAIGAAAIAVGILMIALGLRLKGAKDRLAQRRGLPIVVLTLLTAAMGLSACASTSLQSSWKDPEFSGAPLRAVLVVGVARNQPNRRMFEDNFAQALKAQGTPAVASYPLLPEEGVIPKDRIKQAMIQSGSDSVLVTRVLRVQRNVLVTPGRAAPDYARDDFHGWYSQTYSTPPPAVEQYDVLTIESTLWDLRRERVVWKGTSEATAGKDVATLTGELASALIAKMKSDRVI